MVCTKCHYPDTSVVRSQHNNADDMIKRRRECLRCGHRFNTIETAQESKDRERKHK